MSVFWDIFTAAVVIAGVIGFFYSWLRLVKTSVEKSIGSRDWVSLGAIVLCTVAVFLWFVPLLGNDLGDRVRLAERWAAVSVKICALGLLVAFFGRPRLIVPIGLACFGTAVFWVMSTIP